MYQGAGSLPASEGPVLQWCARESDLLAFPSPYEADCVYKHRYVFTLEHHRILAAARVRDPASAPLSWAARTARAVWRGTCTGALTWSREWYCWVVSGE